MPGTRQTGQPASTRGALYRLRVGIALVSIVPALALWYLHVVLSAEDGSSASYWQPVVALLIVATGVGGFALLRQHAVAVVGLRDQLCRIADGERPIADGPPPPGSASTTMTSGSASDCHPRRSPS